MMKRHTTLLALILIPLMSIGQSFYKNYIKSKVYPVASLTELPDDQTDVDVTYFDGLGRDQQKIAIKAGGSDADIVAPIEYDDYGRQAKSHLSYPVIGTEGNFQEGALPAQEEYYLNAFGTTNPYSEKIFGNSPLNRVLELGAPGDAWLTDPASDTDHTTKFTYQTNIANEVRLFKVNLTADYIPSLDPTLAFYEPNKLSKTTIKDENWQPGDGNDHTASEFKDKQGRLILKRAYNNGTTNDTYYVYDDFGNTTYVIPPKVDTNDGVSQEELDSLCYQYTYDKKNRKIEKQIPGKGKEYIVYNKLGQSILTQDQNLKNNTNWQYIKYDIFERPVYTGIYSSSASREDLQTIADAETILYETKQANANTIGGETVYYTNDAFPNGPKAQPKTIDYYDDYGFDLDGGVEEDAFGVTPTSKTKGLSTGSKIWVSGNGIYDWITTVTYYDEKARPIYTYTKNNYHQTTDKIKTSWSFANEVLETESTHIKVGNAPIVIAETNAYDREGRLLETTHQVDNQDPVLTVNNYNPMGQMIEKNLHSVAGGDFEQSIDYTYNIRGWLAAINGSNLSSSPDGDLFGMELWYNTTNPDLGNTPDYTGNISATQWSNHDTEDTGIETRAYAYAYDPLNQLITANHYTDNSPTNQYGVSGLTYDKNGNIKSLNRFGADIVNQADELNYAYAGNQLMEVSDAGNDDLGFIDGNPTGEDYGYDDNGNLTSDANKGITQTYYNDLNQPIQIVFEPGNQILYTYDAAGTKLEERIYEEAVLVKTTSYAGSYVYVDSALAFIQQSEGRLVPVITSEGEAVYDYQYPYKDHLGNTRLTFSTTHLEYTNIETFEPDTEILYNLEDIVEDKQAANTTPGGSYVCTLESGEMGAYGLERLNTGDTLSINAQFNYEGILGGNTLLGTAFDALFNSFEGTFGSGVEGGISGGSSGEFNNALANMGGKNNANLDPRAFMNYILFDLGMNYVGGGFQQMTTAAQGPGVHETVSINDIIAGQELYVLFYFSNENAEPLSINIDDVTIHHRKTNIVGSDGYYPFGGLFNSFSRTDPTPEDYKYNGKEYMDELGLNLYDYGTRLYDPMIGRFIQIDPLSEVPEQQSYSPYHYVRNNPVRYNDPTGMIWEDQARADRLSVSVQTKIDDLAAEKSEIEADIAKAGGEATRKQKRKLTNIERRTKQLEKSKDDIRALRDDQEHTYRFAQTNNTYRNPQNHGVVKGDDDILTIYASDDGSLIHEIRHVSVGLESGKEFKYNNQRQLEAFHPFGVRDETEGYRAEYGYTGTGPGSYESNTKLLEKLARKENLNGTKVYPAIEKYLSRSKKNRRKQLKLNKKKNKQ